MHTPIADGATTWIAIGSCFTGAGALVTASLAFVTKRIAGETRQLAVETKALTTETKRLAGATEEDVSANWRPVLVCVGGLTAAANRDAEKSYDFGDVRVRLHNAGRGPALGLHVAADSLAVQDRIRTDMTGFGSTVNPGDAVHVTFPGHLLRDPGQQTLAYTIRAQYADLQGRVFETDIRFADPFPGLPHAEPWTATPISFDYRARPDAAILAFEDPPDDDRGWLLPQTHNHAYVSVTEPGDVGLPPPLTAERRAADQ